MLKFSEDLVANSKVHLYLKNDVTLRRISSVEIFTNHGMVVDVYAE